LQALRKIRFDRHAGRPRTGILFKLPGKRETQLGAEQFRVKQHPEPELGARIHHTAEGSCNEEPSCTRVRGGYKTLARLSLLMRSKVSMATNRPQSDRNVLGASLYVPQSARRATGRH
jgi:hypothetical protein